ncbi:MAG: S8/S53 family peptidase [Thermoplasmatota archaeon]
MKFRGMPLAVAAGLVLALLAGCADPADPTQPDPAPQPVESRPAVVIAVIDTGINFYHTEYRRAVGSSPEPADIPERTPVPLTLDAESFDAAEEADHDRLMEMEPETLYTFPGTKILAAISFEAAGSDWPILLDLPDTYAHGTMTSSRAVGNTVSIGGDDPDVWLVLVQGFNTDSVRWAAEQPWIDLISISAGLSPYSIVPGVPNALDTGAIGDYNKASHTKPFFASTGNGVGNAGVAGFPAATRGSSGVPDAVSVGANDNDRMSQWHNQGPYISADGCGNPRADPASLDGILMDGGGTSSATPFSAGGGAVLLLEARRALGDLAVGPRSGGPAPDPAAWSSGRAEDSGIVLAMGNATPSASGPLSDGVFTMMEFKDVLYHTALALATDDESDGDACAGLGESPAPADTLPEDQRFAVNGYGEINHASIEAAVAVVRGSSPNPERPADDASYEQQREVKMQVVGDAEG